MKSLFGETLQFETENEFNDFIDTIDRESNIKILETALNYSSKMGVFTLEESYYIHTCLLKLKNDIS